MALVQYGRVNNKFQNASCDNHTSSHVLLNALYLHNDIYVIQSVLLTPIETSSHSLVLCSSCRAVFNTTPNELINQTEECKLYVSYLLARTIPARFIHSTLANFSNRLLWEVDCNIKKECCQGNVVTHGFRALSSKSNEFLINYQLVEVSR